MELTAAWEFVLRDIRVLASGGAFGNLVLAGIVGVPVASVVQIARRRFLALLALTSWIAMVCVWILYYTHGIFAGGGDNKFGLVVLPISLSILLLVLTFSKRPS